MSIGIDQILMSTKVKQASYFHKNSKLKSIYDIYTDNQITHLGYTGIPSIAARHTALEQGPILFDAGFVPREIGMKKHLILITHFHSDHGSDVCNCIDGGHQVTIFVPAYCALNLFRKIQCDISMQKGRDYTDLEVCKMVRIIGCKRNNGEFADQDKIELNSIKIIELIKMGDHVNILLNERDSVDIEPFSCYHTVDTCGYVVNDVRKKLADNILLGKEAMVEVNFTEDQADEKNKRIIHKNKQKENEQSNDSKQINKFKDVETFSEKHGVIINVSIFETPMTQKFTLRTRRLQFQNGLNLKTKNEKGECILSSEDFAFLSKYKINVTQNILIPHTMFFGDTCSYVFDPIHTQIHHHLNTVKNVIIECTYLENQHDLNPAKYKKRQDKKHMFLFELIPIFKANPGTQFLLIHFSARYNKDIIQKYINDVISTHQCNNVKAFI